MLMSDICNKVLTELRFGSGQDVQIHLQDSIYQNVSRLYRTLMTKHVWRDYFSVGAYTTDINGEITADITAILTKFTNIIAVYSENETQPIPVAPVMSNPYKFRRSALTPSSTTGKVFTIWPKKVQDIVLVSRFFSETDFAGNEDVPFYSDVLITGAAFMLSTKAGTNQELTQVLGAEFKSLVDIHRMNELHDYQTSPERGGIPDEWYVDGN